MSDILNIEFEDFKKLVVGHRIYYFSGAEFMDFYFTTDGMLVKTTIPKSLIENPKQFFSDKIFYGAMRVNFRLMSDDEESDEEPKETEPFIDISEFQDKELKKVDIQPEGVK